MKRKLNIKYIEIKNLSKFLCLKINLFEGQFLKPLSFNYIIII